MLWGVGSTSRLSFKWSVELVGSVRARAVADGLSVNAWVRGVVEEALAVQPGRAGLAEGLSASPRPSAPASEVAVITAAQDARNVAVTGELVDRERRGFRRCPVVGCDFKASSPSPSVTCRRHGRALLDFGA